ncbi:uncharacterized protein BJ171DRAFT_473941 [Polychytrium aggregatum]|uniref:uncharacterized protein n=1 Tax=Polychytrium aggregatum TaxID=110093 RepID=UPI0022FDB9CB|nr:uncharacterized protein BJ171DRAFT_473941 [Polychytrium aggregatum]KAI9205932.1 hypothetical protein BJ171DRAFT_473941 [Polychytrium aggregatum]
MSLPGNKAMLDDDFGQLYSLIGNPKPKVPLDLDLLQITKTPTAESIRSVHTDLSTSTSCSTEATSPTHTIPPTHPTISIVIPTSTTSSGPSTPFTFVMRTLPLKTPVEAETPNPFSGPIPSTPVAPVNSAGASPAIASTTFETKTALLPSSASVRSSMRPVDGFMEPSASLGSTVRSPPAQASLPIAPPRKSLDIPPPRKSFDVSGSYQPDGFGSRTIYRRHPTPSIVSIDHGPASAPILAPQTSQPSPYTRVGVSLDLPRNAPENTEAAAANVKHDPTRVPLKNVLGTMSVRLLQGR